MEFFIISLILIPFVIYCVKESHTVDYVHSDHTD